jgi:hypothetical protein
MKVAACVLVSLPLCVRVLTLMMGNQFLASWLTQYIAVAEDTDFCTASNLKACSYFIFI